MAATGISSDIDLDAEGKQVDYLTCWLLLRNRAEEERVRSLLADFAPGE